MGKHPLYNETGLQKNNKSHVMYALANKQMELKQIQEEYETKISKIKSDLKAMEQVICLFDGNCNETLEKINKKAENSKPRKTRNSYFVKGEAKSVVLKILRGSNRSLSTENIAKQAIIIQNIEQNNDFILKSVSKTINIILRKLESDKKVKQGDQVYHQRY